MQPHESISAAIEAAKAEGRTGLVPFFTAGYPEPAEFLNTLRAIAEVGDVVEIGVPFSDPMADGMTIQRSSFVAIQKGVTLKWIFDQLESIKGEIKIPIVFMSYLNPLLAFGFEALAQRALDTGVCGFIVPDLPFEESGEIRHALEQKGIGLIQLVTPATPAERLKLLARESRGFLYAVTITGITGGDSGLPADLAGYLDSVSEVSTLPVCAGFGIRSAEDIVNVGKHAAGAIVGSALVEVLEQGADPAVFLRQLR
ncbi:MAG: tryptophan synthase subunit alpha [Gammaproteobacteria bacterium]|nr:tryptophan synthase subunit alpha [Pseudomonadota bacterium]TDJ10597.1 MAG: tryptophan synthase subunit alpha [Gammaproteobacteria bacterium]